MEKNIEKGKSKQIIDRLVDMVENGKKVPFSSGKVMIDKDEAILLIKEMENIVNGELKIYRELNDKRGRIISEAKNEAKEIIYEAKESASRIRVGKRMPGLGGFREDKLDIEEREVLRTANDIYAASLIYTDEMLTEVNDMIAESYELVYNQYGRLVGALEEKAKLIADNKAELMTSLRELSKEERYEQIMDLGQILSTELYYERARAKQQERPEGTKVASVNEYGDKIPLRPKATNDIRDRAPEVPGLSNRIDFDLLEDENTSAEEAAASTEPEKDAVKEDTAKEDTAKEEKVKKLTKKIAKEKAKEKTKDTVNDAEKKVENNTENNTKGNTDKNISTNVDKENKEKAAIDRFKSLINSQKNSVKEAGSKKGIVSAYKEEMMTKNSDEKNSDDKQPEIDKKVENDVDGEI